MSSRAAEPWPPPPSFCLSCLRLLPGLLLALGLMGCNRPPSPVVSPSGPPRSPALADAPARTLVTLWDRVLKADPSHRGGASLQELSWEVLRAGQDIEAPAVLLTGRGATVRLLAPVSAFQDSFVAVVREGGTLGYSIQGDQVVLTISGGHYYTLASRPDVHVQGRPLVARVDKAEGLAVFSADHESIRRAFAGLTHYSLDPAATASPPPARGRKSLGVAGKSVADLDAADVVVAMMGTKKGVRVDSVFPGSPAARGGIEVGDILVAFAGHPLDDWRSLKSALASAPVGEPVDVVVFRPSRAARVPLKVVLGDAPGARTERPAPSASP